MSRRVGVGSLVGVVAREFGLRLGDLCLDHVRGDPLDVGRHCGIQARRLMRNSGTDPATTSLTCGDDSCRSRSQGVLHKPPAVEPASRRSSVTDRWPRAPGHHPEPVPVLFHHPAAGHQDVFSAQHGPGLARPLSRQSQRRSGHCAGACAKNGSCAGSVSAPPQGRAWPMPSTYPPGQSARPAPPRRTTGRGR